MDQQEMPSNIEIRGSYLEDTRLFAQWVQTVHTELPDVDAQLLKLSASAPFKWMNEIRQGNTAVRFSADDLTQKLVMRDSVKAVSEDSSITLDLEEILSSAVSCELILDQTNAIINTQIPQPKLVFRKDDGSSVLLSTFMNIELVGNSYSVDAGKSGIRIEELRADNSLAVEIVRFKESATVPQVKVIL